MVSGQGCLNERLQLCTELWAANIKTEMVYKARPKLLNQFMQAEEGAIPLVAVVGPDELAIGQVKVCWPGQQSKLWGEKKVGKVRLNC